MNIFGIGTVVVDHVIELSSFPAEDTKIETHSHWTQMGGPVPVALSTAAFYGATTSFLGRWADDEAGRFIGTTLQERGIDVSACRSNSGHKWSSGFAHVWVTPATGTRTIAYSRGTFPIPNADDVPEDLLKAVPLLHLDGWAGDAAIKAATIVKKNGGTVILDAGSVKPRLDELLPLVDILIASKLFLNSRFGEDKTTPKDLLSLGPRNVITTNGSAGSTWLTRDEEIHEPAIAVDAIDTNGAGDIFSGGILHSIQSKKTARKSLRFANEVAGYACLRKGNNSLPADTSH